jgi:multiple sugar transport system permease protein
MATVTSRSVGSRGPAKVVGEYAAKSILAIFFGFPVVFMFVSSLKPDEQIFSDLGSLRAFLPLGDIVISTATVVIGLFVNSLAAFGLQRMRWRGRSVVLSLIIATLVVPFETFALPMVWWVNKLPWPVIQDGQLLYSVGWLDSYHVQILPFLANAFSIFLFYSYFQTIPKELDEAAKIDGAGWSSTGP